MPIRKNNNCHKFINFIKNKLGRATHKSGKIFYSSPRSLHFGRYILMGYNAGGDPKNKDECAICDNLQEWITTRRNHYWHQKWNKNHTDFNPLQKRIQTLFGNLGIKPANVFTTNLWFFRSRSASTLCHDDGMQNVCMQIWKRILLHSPARRIICMGVQTASEFLKQIGAEDNHWKRVKTCHPRADAELINATIQGKKYKIVAVPHLSRFSVAGDKHLIRKIKRHFN